MIPSVFNRDVAPDRRPRGGRGGEERRASPASRDETGTFEMVDPSADGASAEDDAAASATSTTG